SLYCGESKNLSSTIQRIRNQICNVQNIHKAYLPAFEYFLIIGIIFVASFQYLFTNLFGSWVILKSHSNLLSAIHFGARFTFPASKSIVAPMDIPRETPYSSRCLYKNFSPLGDPRETARTSGLALRTRLSITFNSLSFFSNPNGGEYVPTIFSPW